jgi:acetyl coenzyme A synthetase (ADP forming)-like protein
MQRIRPRYLPALADEPAESGRALLRDGSVVLLRIARPEDGPAFEAFVSALSPDSRRHRFFSESAPPSEALFRLCEASDPRTCMTLVAVREVAGRLHIVGSGSYFARDPATAEVAFAVADDLRGHGLGTILLERLALLALQQGFSRLWAVTHADNAAMREVFVESGLTVRESLEGGDIEVEISLVPTEAAAQRAEWRERVATQASLRPLLHPASVAIVGASRDPQSIGYRLLEAARVNEFRGRIYAVNPHAAGIGGVPAYPSMRALPGPVDLAVIAVPRDIVPKVVDDCASAGVRALVVISSGFAEVGTEGRRRQDSLLEAVRRHGMRMIGPNCFGILNTDPDVHLNATFTSVFPRPGRIAMSSQSGALGLALLAATERLQLGISTFVSVGNKADVSVNDLLQYWENDAATGVILLYVESFGNPRKFSRIARRVTRQKPVIALKAGRTSSGRRAAGSHTAALAADNVAVEALFRQTGIVRADTLEDLFALALGFAEQPLPPGRRVGIVTNAGGPGILCADACEAGGLIVPTLSESTVSRLRSFLPSAAALQNPVDLIASATPEQYEQAVQALLGSDDVDALIVLYIAVTKTDTGPIAEGIRRGIIAGRTAQKIGKPIAIVWMAEADRDRRFLLPAETIPTFDLPELPARVLSRAADYAEWRSSPPGMVPDFDDLRIDDARQVCRDALARRGAGWLTVNETRQVLEAFCLPVPAGGVAETADEAVALADRIGFPVAVKLASHRLVHKTEIGGVRLNLKDRQSVREAYDQIRARLDQEGKIDAMEGVLVQPMLKGGVEVMAGMTQDPSFGPLIGFGLGGIHVEILGDVQFRVTPLTELDAADMVRSIKGRRLLEGYRGHPPADIGAIEDLLLRLSRLVEETPEIVELDLNPIFALPPGQGCLIADARIRLAC